MDAYNMFTLLQCSTGVNWSENALFNYASVRMHQQHTVRSRFVYLCL